MNIRSIALGALVLSVLAPAAFAASSTDNSWLYRDKANSGGALLTVDKSDTAAASDTAAFEAFEGEVKTFTAPVGDYWPGKSDNGYNN